MSQVPEIHPEQFLVRITKDLVGRRVDVNQSPVPVNEYDGGKGFSEYGSLGVRQPGEWFGPVRLLAALTFRERSAYLQPGQFDSVFLAGGVAGIDPWIQTHDGCGCWM